MEVSQQRRRYERNPYYWKVDPSGRQLPYIDEVDTEYANDLETIQLKTQSGSFSVSAFNLLLSNYPVLKTNEEEGNYRALLLDSPNGADVALGLNQVHGDEVLRDSFNDVRFRQALSVAIDREKINQIVYLGQGVPRQATVNSDAAFFQKEWADAYTEFDQDLAHSLLDEVGLTNRNDAGIRLFPDGRPVSFNISFAQEEGPKSDVIELVAQDLRAVGLNVESAQRSKSYMLTLVESGDFDVTAWHINRVLERAAWVQATENNKLRAGGSDVLTYADAWHRWFESDGQDGIEPPSEAKELQSAYEEWQQLQLGTSEYTSTAERIYSLVAEMLWVIGIVGENPKPIAVTGDLENVFSGAVMRGDDRVWFGAGSWSWQPHQSEQWFFKT